MMSGKSTTMIRYLERAIRGKKKVCLIRPFTDNREFLSHSKATEYIFNELSIPVINMPSFKIEEPIPFFNELIHYDVIGIDECQFIDNLDRLIKVLNYTTVQNIYMAGLLATSENKIFPNIASVLPFCEEIIKLNSVCVICGSQLGNYTYYKPGKKDTEVVIGGANLYDARCKDCI